MQGRKGLETFEDVEARLIDSARKGLSEKLPPDLAETVMEWLEAPKDWNTYPGLWEDRFKTLGFDREIDWELSSQRWTHYVYSKRVEMDFLKDPVEVRIDGLKVLVDGRAYGEIRNQGMIRMRQVLNRAVTSYLTDKIGEVRSPF
jgi:hypothetical protein